MLGQSPASELGIKEEIKFKHKCNNKNQHKASLRTEREITWSEGGTLPLSYFLIPFQIIFPSSSPLPGASRSMQHSHEEQPSDSPTLPRDQLHPGYTCRLPRETRFLEGLMVREAQVAANRRLWLIICSHLMGEENKPFFFVPVLLFLLFRDCHYQSGTPSLLLVASGVGEKMGQGGVLGNSDSSLRQQDEEDGLEEVTKTANSSHEPVGVKVGVSIHHTFCDVCLMRRKERLSERSWETTWHLHPKEQLNVAA